MSKKKSRLSSQKHQSRKGKQKQLVNNQSTEHADSKTDAGNTELGASENGMDVSVNTSFIESLQEDIKISCQKLEEKGHESLLITVSDDGHLVFGSEKGKRFLGERYGLIADFIRYCADSDPVIKVEDVSDMDVQKITMSVEQPANSSVSANSLTDSHTTPTALNTTESEMFDDDTDDYEDTQSFDESCLGDLATETDVKESENSQQQDKEGNRTNEKKIIPYKSKKLNAAAQESRLQKGNVSKPKERADKLNDGIGKVVLNRLKSGKKLVKTEIGKKPVRSKSLVTGDMKACFPCGKCGFVFNFDSHLVEHNQRNLDCKAEDPVSSEEKDESILQSEVTFKDLVSGEMRTRTVRELLAKTDAPFTCEVCCKTFDLFHKLKRHVFPHADFKPYKCNICCQTFNMEENLRQHTRQHNRRPFHCTKCLSRYDTEAKLNGHIVLCTAKDFLMCAVCDYKASTVDDLISHKRSHPSMREGSRTNCNICGKELNNTYSVIRHKQSFHNDEFPHECKICGKKYKVELTLRRHLVTHGEPIYRCKLCDYGCYLRANLRIHMISHTNERPYVCDFCGKQYRAKNLLDNHRRIHTGERPYACDFEGCGKAFRSLMTLKQHKCSHATSYAYMCDFCGRNFKVKSALRHHRKDHIIEFRWPCPYCEEKFKSCDRYKTHVAKFHPDKIKEVETGSNIKFYPCTQCERVLIDIEDFREHMNVHTGNRPHKCRHCGKGFSSRKNMRQHEKSHTGEQKLRCRLCPKKYSDPKALKVHLKNRHNIRPDTDSEPEVGMEKGKNTNMNESQSAVKKLLKKDESEASGVSQNFPSISLILTADTVIHPGFQEHKPVLIAPDL